MTKPTDLNTERLLLAPFRLSSSTTRGCSP